MRAQLVGHSAIQLHVARRERADIYEPRRRRPVRPRDHRGEQRVARPALEANEPRGFAVEFDSLVMPLKHLQRPRGPLHPSMTGQAELVQDGIVNAQLRRRQLQDPPGPPGKHGARDMARSQSGTSPFVPVRPPGGEPVLDRPPALRYLLLSPISPLTLNSRSQDMRNTILALVALCGLMTIPTARAADEKWFKL